MAHIHRILKKGHSLTLAFDQGLEHGPKIFDQHTINPAHIFNLALEGRFNALAVQPGIAEKYYKGAFRDLPLIVKLNGRTELSHVNPVARQYCSVDRAVKLGADAVGYTIYDGVPAESNMFVEFGTIVEQAHDYGIPVVAWMYPRNADGQDTDAAAYAARIGLELGADFVKIKYNKNPQGFPWVVSSAGRAKVLISDFDHASDEELLHHVHSCVKQGACGAAFGRTIWQHPRPFQLTRALQEIIFNKRTPDEAAKYLQ